MINKISMLTMKSFMQIDKIILQVFGRGTSPSVEYKLYIQVVACGEISF